MPSGTIAIERPALTQSNQQIAKGNLHGRKSSWAGLELAQRIAGAGTLSGAARLLGVNQTTAARRLAALERRMGASLFDRVGGRLAPTPALAAVLDRLQAMDEDATVALAGLRRSEAEMRGEARIASVGFMLANVLAPALGEFAAPILALRYRFTPTDPIARFNRREADIAVRLGRTGDDFAGCGKSGTCGFAFAGPPAGKAATPRRRSCAIPTRSRIFRKCAS